MRLLEDSEHDRSSDVLLESSCVAAPSGDGRALSASQRGLRPRHMEQDCMLRGRARHRKTRLSQRPLTRRYAW